MTHLDETCACGSNVTYDGDSINDALELLDDWRKNHRHDLPAKTDSKQPPAPETHAVTGTHHQAGPVRNSLPAGRRIGFQHNEPTTEKENPHD